MEVFALLLRLVHTAVALYSTCSIFHSKVHSSELYLRNIILLLVTIFFSSKLTSVSKLSSDHLISSILTFSISILPRDQLPFPSIAKFHRCLFLLRYKMLLHPFFRFLPFFSEYRHQWTETQRSYPRPVPSTTQWNCLRKQRHPYWRRDDAVRCERK